MKHLFLPLPIDTVREAWEDWRESGHPIEEEVRLVETSGGCVVVTSSGRPPRVVVELLKAFLSQNSSKPAAA